MQYQDYVPLEDQVAEVSIAYSCNIPSHKRISVTTVGRAAILFRKTWNLPTLELKETVRVMLLNAKMELLGIATVSDGGMTTCYVDLRLLFMIALKSAAVAIVLAHNHPSGNLSPSEKDIELAVRISAIGKVMQIEVIDHLIITKDGFASIEV